MRRVCLTPFSRRKRSLLPAARRFLISKNTGAAVGKSDTPENRVKAEVMKYLKLRRIYCWSNPSGAVRIRPGKFMSFGKKGSYEKPDGPLFSSEGNSAG
jgi:hypothetical protein